MVSFSHHTRGQRSWGRGEMNSMNPSHHEKKSEKKKIFVLFIIDVKGLMIKISVVIWSLSSNLEEMNADGREESI